jgi:alkylmercury lyase
VRENKEIVSMLDIPLQEIITAYTDAVAANQEGFLLLIRLLQLLASGNPVSPEQLATATHHTRSEIEAFLQSTDLVVDHDGSLELAPDPHVVHLEKKTLTGACALDTLVYPVLLGRSARVVSTCPATGKEIRLTVTAQGRTQDLDPQAAVVSLRLPGPETNIYNVCETICHYGHFFADREHASIWPDLHPEAVLLSVEDAAHLAHEIAHVSRKYAEKAQI